MKLKVCGMRDEVNIAEVASLRPDYMGFIFYPNSKRYVGDNFIVPETLPSEIARVGVCVDEEKNVILQKAAVSQLRYVQLHGSETAEFCADLKANGFGVIKAFGVDIRFDFNDLAPYRHVVDFFLFDARGEMAGGNGITFDWSCLQRYDQKIPFFLSGGISPENIIDVRDLNNMNLHAIDINSGVEIKPGMKDPVRILDLQSKMPAL